MLAVLLAGFLLPAGSVPRAADEKPPTEDASSIGFPTTIDQVWYRAEKKRVFGGGQLTGDLTVTTEALEFISRKRELRLPLDQIQMVSFGKMRGDVDTDWVVLALGPPGATALAGFRDGSKMGYGERTGRIHEVILEAVKRAAAAQYGVPPGFEAYVELQDQFALALPEGWTAYHQSIAEIEGRLLWGRTIFSALPITGSAYDPGRLRQMLRDIDRGDGPAVILERREALRGMRCSGFSGSGEEKLLGWIAEDPLFAAGYEMVEAPRVEPMALGDCIGRSVLVRARGAEGGTTVELRVVSDDETVFLFSRRLRGGAETAAPGPFERIVASFKTSVAR